jgi:LPXTG-motif cell wall-anchored protein
MLRRSRVIGWVTGLVVFAAIAVGGQPAQATTWPLDGKFTISGLSGGGASWYLSGGGLDGAGDVNDDFASLYYPLIPSINSIYLNPLHCGANDPSTSEVIYESNGDITINCLPVADGFPGITYTLHYRFYSEAPTGYLARQWIEFTNTSTDIAAMPTPVNIEYVFDEFSSTNLPWLSSSGADGLSNGDAWAVGGDSSGTATVTSSAWAAPCGSKDWTAAESSVQAPLSIATIPVGQSVNFVSFINMTFPATQDATGAADAFALGVAQAQNEYSAGFTGRLAAGLPERFVASGWNDGACAPTLPNTGVDASLSTGIAVGAGLLTMLGLALSVARRRARNIIPVETANKLTRLSR